MKTNERQQNSSSAFTLIEMLVVVAIIVVITGTVLANNSKFGGVVQLQNLAYDIALSTREAQVYGVSVLRFGTSFTAAFGVHYDISNAADSKTYTIFADVTDTANTGTPDGIFQTSEIVQQTDITRGYYIGQLCVTLAGVEDCSPTSVDITYNHPEPDAYIRAGGNPSTLYEKARIVVMSPRGDQMSVEIENNGQISVHN